MTDGNGTILFSYHDEIAHVMDQNIALANEILNASGYDWPTYPDGYRVIGDVAAKRLVGMGAAADNASAQMDPKTGIARILQFEDIFDQAAYDAMETSKYYASQWNAIGVKLTPTAVNPRAMRVWVPGFENPYTETTLSGDPDPNYLLYTKTSYAMDGWDRYGPPSYGPDWWNASAHGGKNYYDYCFDMQQHSLDESERIKWVQECEKILFLSGTAPLTVCSPNACLGYLDWRLTNWGDFEKHIGMNPYSKWPLKPVFSEVKWVSALYATDSTMNPTIILSAVMIGSVLISEVVCFKASKGKSNWSEDEDIKGNL